MSPRNKVLAALATLSLPFLLGIAVPPAGAGELIYSQPWDSWTSFASAQYGNVSQEAADDFELLADVDRVVAQGYKANSTYQILGVHVRFYALGGDGRPGALQAEYFLSAGDPGFTFEPVYGDWLDVTLAPAFRANGRHFVSVQPVTDGPWYWWNSNRGAPLGEAVYTRSDEGEWSHPLDLWGQPERQDLAFSLYGSMTGPGRIDSLSAGTLAKSGYLEVFGAGFGGSGQVLIDGASAPVGDWSSTRIVAYVPEAAQVGPVPVQVVTSGGASNVVTLTVADRRPDGRVRWRLRMVGPYSVVRPARGPDGTVYSIDVYGHLYAVRPDGGLKWVVRGAGDKGLAVSADGTVYTGSEDAIKAFNPDGTPKWTFVQDPRAFILLGLSVGPEGNLYGVATQGMGVFSLTPGGAERWRTPETYSRRIVDYGEIVFGPNGGRDQLYFYANNHTRAVRLEDGASVFTIAPTGQPVVSPFDATVHAKASAYTPTGQLLWSFAFPISGTPVSDPDIGPDGTHYVVNRQLEVWAINPDGSARWSVTLPDYMGPPNVDPTGALLVLGSGGTLDHAGFVEALGTTSRKILWRVDLPAEETTVFNPWTGQYGFNQYVDTRATFSSDGLTAYIITAIATGGLVTDRCFLHAIDTSASTAPPASSVLRSASIVLSARTRRGATSVTGIVAVRDGNGQAVSGATVQAAWILPNGTTAAQSAITNTKGEAKFGVSDGGGTYTLTVTEVAKVGYTFDRAGSLLSKSLTTK